VSASPSCGQQCRCAACAMRFVTAPGRSVAAAAKEGARKRGRDGVRGGDGARKRASMRFSSAKCTPVRLYKNVGVLLSLRSCLPGVPVSVSFLLSAPRASPLTAVAAPQRSPSRYEEALCVTVHRCNAKELLCSCPSYSQQTLFLHTHTLSLSGWPGNNNLITMRATSFLLLVCLAGVAWADV
jgi:hypothetical protein